MTFKGTSQASQWRTTQATERKRPVLDPTAFKSRDAVLSDRDAAVARKMQIQGELGKIRADLHEAAIRRFNKGLGPIPSVQTIAAWERRKKDLMSELHDVEMSFVAIKQSQRDSNKSDELEFSEMFKQVAKEILAHEVYDRVVYATIHRLREKCQ